MTPTIEERAKKMLDWCLIRMQSLGYDQHSLSYSLPLNDAVNAYAIAIGNDAIDHRIEICEGLLRRFDDVAQAFAVSNANGMPNDMQNIVRLINAKILRKDTSHCCSCLRLASCSSMR